MKTGRRTYYNAFSHVYDLFIKLHARRDGRDTRRFLSETAALNGKPGVAILDICCGTGDVILAFAADSPHALSIGYDFSRGMLRKAQGKPGSARVSFIEGDATSLPFPDERFDVVTCSHALYELKGQARQKALREMKRVVRSTGIVLLMEHEVPQHPFTKFMFNLRMLTLGSADAREFVQAGLAPYAKVFPDVTLTHSPSGKSKLVMCRKQRM